MKKRISTIWDWSTLLAATTFALIIYNEAGKKFVHYNIIKFQSGVYVILTGLAASLVFTFLAEFFPPVASVTISLLELVDKTTAKQGESENKKEDPPDYQI